MDQIVRAHPFSRLSAFVFLAVGLLVIVAAIPLEQQGCQLFFDLDAIYPADRYDGVIAPIAYFGFTFLGALIILYQSGNRIGWLLAAVGNTQMISWLAIHAGDCLNAISVESPLTTVIPWAIVLTAFLTLTFFGFLFMVFPNGRYISPRWRWASFLIFASMIVYSIGVLFSQVDDPPSSPEALGSYVAPMFIFPLVGILSLFLRWRRETGDVRQQIKWIAFFLAAMGPLFIGTEIVGTIVYPEIFYGWYYFLLASTFTLGFPTVLGIAIFRYRLYDIDVIIRRTAQYASVSAVLAVTYYGSVVLLQTIFTNIVQEQSPLIIVLSTLITVVLFNPLRTRLQIFIDRHFYRQKYDAQQILTQFARTARDEVEIDALQVELLQVVQETMQPEQISVWIKPGRRVS